MYDAFYLMFIQDATHQYEPTGIRNSVKLTEIITLIPNKKFLLLFSFIRLLKVNNIKSFQLAGQRNGCHKADVRSPIQIDVKLFTMCV